MDRKNLKMRRYYKIYLIMNMLFVICIIAILFTSCNLFGKKITIRYTAGEGGQILFDGDLSEELEQQIGVGLDSKIVEAKADLGYRFIKWSDGNTNCYRNELHVDRDIQLFAYFERLKLDVSYTAYGGGTIKGKLTQEILYGEDAESVVAIPEVGYKFLEWTDGSKEPVRKDLNVSSNLNIGAVFSTSVQYEVRFIAEKGGMIEGSLNQRIEEGEDSDYVRAIANDGFEFVEWSDGVKSAERNLCNVQKQTELYAKFKKVKQRFKLEYNGATNNNNVSFVDFSYNQLSGMQITTPKKDGFIFRGWYLEWQLMTKVTDDLGYVVVDNSVFDSNSESLYAKWEAEDKTYYKVLMVYVTEVNANLKTKNGDTVNVKYCQSETEKLIRQQTSEYIDIYLNAMLNGKVNFIIDTYYTSAPITENEIRLANSLDDWEYYLFAEDIPEIQDFILNYNSVIITFNMEDYYDFNLHQTAGMASKKSAVIHDESVIGNYYRDEVSVEDLLDNSQASYAERWDNIIGLYLHEFTHTVELSIENNDYGYHTAIGDYCDKYGAIKDELIVIKLYLNGEVAIDGKLLGIPELYWKKTNK